MKNCIPPLYFNSKFLYFSKKYNEHLETPISSEKLKQDIDYAYLKLQNFILLYILIFPKRN